VHNRFWQFANILFEIKPVKTVVVVIFAVVVVIFAVVVVIFAVVVVIVVVVAGVVFAADVQAAAPLKTTEITWGGVAVEKAV